MRFVGSFGMEEAKQVNHFLGNVFLCYDPEAVIGRQPHPIGYAPIGNVNFCEKHMRNCGMLVPKPDFYPKFLEHMMFRDHTTLELADRYFIKSGSKYKQFPAFVEKDFRIILCEPVNFTQEWRYYVSNGKVLFAAWYKGEDDEEPAPELLDVVWPKDYCGAVDFGRLDTGQVALVEAHHPYACGLYDHTKIGEYAQWSYEGWKYLIKISVRESNSFL